MTISYFFFPGWTNSDNQTGYNFVNSTAPQYRMKILLWFYGPHCNTELCIILIMIMTI